MADLWRACDDGAGRHCVCERCGYGRPATDLETPFNGIGEPHYNMTFGEGMSQGAPIPKAAHLYL